MFPTGTEDVENITATVTNRIACCQWPQPGNSRCCNAVAHDPTTAVKAWGTAKCSPWAHASTDSPTAVATVVVAAAAVATSAAVAG